MNVRRGKAGFTIVELLVVIVVIAILATLTVVTYNGIQNRAREVALTADLRSVADQLKIDYARSGRFMTEEAFNALNGGNGPQVSDGTTLLYHPDNASSPRTFCVTGYNSGIAFMVTENAAPVEGVCTGDPEAVADSGGDEGGDDGGDGGGGTPEPPALHPNLVAAYGFNEISGTTFANQVPGGTPATLWTGAQITTGHTGNAVVGTSSRQAAVLQGSPAIASQGWTGMTVSYWQYRTSTTGDFAPITFYTNASRGETDWGGIWYSYSSDLGSWLYLTGDNWPDLQTTASMPQNEWQYITMTWSGASNKMKFYINGALVHTVNTSGSALARSAAVVDIGGNDYSEKRTVGRIDDLRIYSAALSDAEIETDMNTPVP